MGKFELLRNQVNDTSFEKYISLLQNRQKLDRYDQIEGGHVFGVCLFYESNESISLSQ